MPQMFISVATDKIKLKKEKAAFGRLVHLTRDFT